MARSKSRYAQASVHTVTTSTGDEVACLAPPVRPRPPVRGIYPAGSAQRLDLIAAHFLGDPSGTWQLCDANGTMCPDALGVRDDIAIPGEAE